MRTLMLALTALLAFASTPVKTMEFVEGRHYQTLDTPRTDAPSYRASTTLAGRIDSLRIKPSKPGCLI